MQACVCTTLILKFCVFIHFSAQIQKIKNAVPKGDKKKKKESAEQIAILEAAMDVKQDEETTYFKSREMVCFISCFTQIEIA